ncbi:MAG: hypothetical protein ACK5XS_12665 [Armatimonadota bacterium]|jgi:hypothetical protein|nr:hypothetical protein [Fimbriimonadaceae bacterium]MCZ8139330.1 hypothetical protein [Fimbriimonadaceae bacterium]
MKYESYASSCQEIANKADRMCCLSACAESQDEALSELEHGCAHYASLLGKAIGDQSLQDEIVNNFYILHLSLDIRRIELKMWVALREQRYHEAWDMLICAQTAWHHAEDTGAIAGASLRLKKLQCLEHILFPPQTYMSPGMIVKYVCSICSLPIIECSHIRGRVYRGKRCYYIGDIQELREASVVFVPADKRCRIHVLRVDDYEIDTLTYARVAKSIGQEASE